MATVSGQGKARREAVMAVDDVTLRRSVAEPILEGISFEVYEGEFLSIIGASGIGKTTLLQSMAGLIRPVSGRISYKGGEVAAPRVEIGLVYQNYALFPWRTALENVEFGLEIKDIPRARRRQMAAEALDLMGLAEDKHKFPIELSGGMQQRVAIARELVNKPDVLLLDEGFSALDIQTRRQTEEQIIQIQKELGITIVLVTHMVDQALALSDRAIVLSDGRIKKVMALEGRKPRDTDAPAFRKLLHETEAMIRPTPKIETFVKDLEAISSKKQRAGAAKG